MSTTMTMKLLLSKTKSNRLMRPVTMGSVLRPTILNYSIRNFSASARPALQKKTEDILEEYDTIVVSDALLNSRNDQGLKICLHSLTNSAKALKFYSNSDTVTRYEFATNMQRHL